MMFGCWTRLRYRTSTIGPLSGSADSALTATTPLRQFALYTEPKDPLPISLKIKIEIQDFFFKIHSSRTCMISISVWSISSQWNSISVSRALLSAIPSEFRLVAKNRRWFGWIMRWQADSHVQSANYWQWVPTSRKTRLMACDILQILFFIFAVALCSRSAGVAKAILSFPTDNLNFLKPVKNRSFEIAERIFRFCS